MMEFVRWLIFIKIVSQVVKRLKKIVVIEKGCDNWKRFWLKKFMLVLHACNFSSNVNEVIRVALNSLFFLRKDFARTKSTKIAKSTKDATKQKHENANKQISDFFPFRFFYVHFLFLFAVGVSCFLYLWNFWMSKIVLITSSILLLNSFIQKLYPLR